MIGAWGVLDAGMISMYMWHTIYEGGHMVTIYA